MYPAPKKLSKFAKFLWISKFPQFDQTPDRMGIVRSKFIGFSTGATYVKALHGAL